MELLLKRKQIVSLLLKQNVLVSQAIVEKLQQPGIVQEWHEKLTNGTPYSQLLNTKAEPRVVDQQASAPSIEIIKTYDREITKKSIQDFISYYNNRFKQLSKLLQTRGELQNLTSITRTLQKQDRERLSVIGFVVDKQMTKNDNMIITLEDDTGRTKAIVGHSKTDLMKVAKDLARDEVIGIKGSTGDKVIFAEEIIHPDVPLTQEFKKCDEDINVAVLSDMHVGSDLFKEKEFQEFLNWTKGDTGNSNQRMQAEKTKYILILGDLIDGVGIYPGQEKELKIPDIYDQYEKVAELLSQIPKDKQLIIIPGNHEAGRIAEPQPPIGKDYAKTLCQMPNVTNLSNPSMVRIHTTKTLSGFDFLMYHGYSYTYYGDTVESIRASAKNISERVGPTMQFLLQRRHLAPSHGSTLYIPDKHEDPLVIDKVPDFFVSGHIHKVAMSHYRGVSLVSGGCWQDKTQFQEKMGHEPEPCKVPLIHLKTRNTTLLDFT